jgi:hypothetical protein
VSLKWIIIDIFLREETGILASRKGGREKIYLHTALLKLLAEL